MQNYRKKDLLLAVMHNNGGICIISNLSSYRNICIYMYKPETDK